MKIVKISFIFLVLLNCNSKDADKSKILEPNYDEVEEITCYLITLDGENKMYTIIEDSIFFDNKREKIRNEDLKIISNIPKTFQDKEIAFGCGVCVDDVDFKFVLKFKNQITTLKVQAGYTDIPYVEYLYINTLLKLYNTQY